MGPRLATAVVAALLLIAGCAAPMSGPDARTTTLEHGAYLAVTEVPAAEARSEPPARRAVFETLPEPKRAEFLRALEGRDKTRADAWSSGADVAYVRYEGSWYRVQVHLV